eukprot:1603902-Amphidinium_carterae.3
MYAQTGLFPLHFHKKLIAYFDESIGYQCDSNAEARSVREHFAELDSKYGTPNDLVIPTEVHVNWCRWVHAQTVNDGYASEDSIRWLLEQELNLSEAVKGIPPSTPRMCTESPDGLFPQNWPEPDAGGS